MKTYKIIGYALGNSIKKTGLDIPVPDEWTLRVTGSTCAVFRRGKALGGGTIVQRERVTWFEPPVLKVAYKGTLDDMNDTFAIVCEASEQEIADELAEDGLDFTPKPSSGSDEGGIGRNWYPMNPAMFPGLR
ncbi:MAG: hypothetical protein KGJ35_00470 [Patescibacteria group bacterium]|nr:hypothetical protein [Patescibacteria group bacterium]